MRIAPFNALIPDFCQIQDPEAFCATTRDRFVQDRAAGLYRDMAQSAMYVLQIQDTTRCYIGLVATTPLADLLNNHIRQHEQTILAKEAQQLALFLAWNAMPKPALLTYRPVAAITNLLEQIAKRQSPQTTVHFGKETHSLWPITAPDDQKTVQALFEQEVPYAYIADGHHRVTAVRHWQEQQPDAAQCTLFCAYFGADMVRIGDFNRVLVLPEYESVADFLQQLSAVATLRKDEFGMMNDECIIRNDEGGMRSDEFGMRNDEGGMRNDEFRMRNDEYGMRNDEGRMMNDECRMRNDEGGMRNDECRMRNDERCPANKHELTCFDGKHWYRLRWREEALAQSDQVLDVQYFNEWIVKNILQSADVRTDARIRYVEGSRGSSGIEEEVCRYPKAVGFMLYPVAFDNMAALSDQGIMLPPKSTFFEPRIRSGLIVKPL
jgi:uncharacterized protein (DUF1015 family)